MKKNIIIFVIGLIVLVLGLRFLSGEDDWICSNGEWVAHGKPSSPMPTESCDEVKLPKGYSLDSYTIVQTSELSCKKNSDCATPGKYLVQSNCPYASICLQQKCAVVCPGH